MNNENRRPVPQGSGRAARIRRRRRKRIALFASFVVIILLMIFAVVLLALEIADTSSEIDDLKGEETKDTVNTPNGDGEGDGATDSPIGDNYVAAENNVKISEGVLILVNKDHEYVFPSVDSRLINVFDSREKNESGGYSFMCSTNTIRMDKTAFAAFSDMMDAFVAETSNKYAMISDAYRSYSDQEGKSIPAGYSDHHTGYLFSLKFYDDTGIYHSDNSSKYFEEYTWLANNAAKYGYIVRYPAAKAGVTGVSEYTYCYRYVGTAHATYMAENNLCLEEYVSLISSSYKVDGNHLLVAADGHNYEIYYVPAGEQVYVPAVSRGYEISGDNAGGYIVTVQLT